MNLPGIIYTGTESAKWYHHTLHKLYRNHVGEHATFPFIGLQTNFEPINALLPHKTQDAAKLLEPYVLKMEQMTDAPYILANITLHECLEYFNTNPKNFISIADILKNEIQSFRGTIGILGTKYTMTNQFLPSLLPNVEFYSLPNSMIHQIDDLRKIFYQKKDVKIANSVFNELKKHPVDIWLIACTELSVAFDVVTDKSIPTINLPELQIQYLIKEKLKESTTIKE